MKNTLEDTNGFPTKSISSQDYNGQSGVKLSMKISLYPEVIKVLMPELSNGRGAGLENSLSKRD